MNTNHFDYSNDSRVIAPPGFSPVFESGFAGPTLSPSYYTEAKEKRQTKLDWVNYLFLIYF
jgi:hypothetical protein